MKPEHAWAMLPDEFLLDWRFCDLSLTIKGSGLEPYLERLYEELEQKGITFRPHFWLSYEWFVADGVPGIAIPFYLAHPRLKALERRQMLDVEGGTPRQLMQILRHEAGHAIENAYGLRRRKSVQYAFGPSTIIKYPTHYCPKPYSRSFVRHLEPYYAQCHPDEDFAETFAVWLTPRSGWRENYAAWPTAFRKLQFMDDLMKELAGQKPEVSLRTEVDPVRRLRRRLRTHYARRREHFGIDRPRFPDEALFRLFSPEGRGERATAFLRRLRRKARRRISLSTGEYQYIIDKVIEDMIERCRELNLRVDGSRKAAEKRFSRLLTRQTRNYVESGHHHVAL